ncbi:hypothetical protein B0H14DRAFT_2571323 [Mycena olivaceomarginata]|nr:hypothetical protein B0H14DRAFT_2571323 [Mycena olivaceomarginata]
MEALLDVPVSRQIVPALVSDSAAVTQPTDGPRARTVFDLSPHHVEGNGFVGGAMEDGQDATSSPPPSEQNSVEPMNSVSTWTDMQIAVFGSANPADDELTDEEGNEGVDEAVSPKSAKPSRRTRLSGRWISPERSPSPGDVEKIPDYPRGGTRSGRSFL